MIWSLKSVNAQFHRPAPIPISNQGTSWSFVEHFLDWYNSNKDRPSIHPEKAIFQFVDDYVEMIPNFQQVYREFTKKKQPQFANEKAKHEALFKFVSDFFDQTRNKFLQTKNEFRYQQQDAILVIERLLSTNELANYCPHFREAVMVPTCRSSGQLCTHKHVVYNPRTSDFAGVLQGTVKNEGNDNLQHIVDEQQGDQGQGR